MADPNPILVYKYKIKLTNNNTNTNEHKQDLGTLPAMTFGWAGPFVGYVRLSPPSIDLYILQFTNGGTGIDETGIRCLATRTRSSSRRR